MYNVLNCEGYEKISKKYNISSLSAKAMIGYNLTFTNKIQYYDPYKYNNMDKVVGMILNAISNKKKIVIYGDYDADGICSVAILVRMFNLIGYDVGYYVPNRYSDGYGLNVEMVEKFYQKQYDLIICVDNGIKAFEAISLAKKYSMEVLVLDHHTKEENLPVCDLYLHPQYSNFAEYNMCGASVCYNLSKAILDKEDYKILSLAGIATIGDVMPLIEQNKLIVSKAIGALNKYHYKAIDLLSDCSTYDESIIAMSVVPKLNSVGRICKGNIINKLVNYLISDDEKELLKMSKFIKDTNQKRKEISEESFKNIDIGKYTDKIIVEKSDNTIEGINGILAAKFANKYNLPAFIFSLSDENLYKGSARSVSNFNVLTLLENNEFVDAYGGHSGAAGVTIKKENYENFKKDLIDKSKNNIYEDCIYSVIEINADELSYKNYLDLNKFSPFGEGNPSPLFLLRNIHSSFIKLSKDKKHILLNINNDTNLVGFNLANHLKDDIIYYDLIFTIELNNLFKNKITCKCVLMEGSKNVQSNNN